MRNLVDYLGNRVIGVAARYQTGSGQEITHDIDVYICAVNVRHDNSVTVHFHKGHHFEIGDLVTIHLDNRTGVSEYDAELKVYRLSYKGIIHKVDGDFCEIHAREFQVFYGISIVMEYKLPHYEFPVDDRTEQPLPITPLEDIPEMDLDEHDNKIGVLITKAMEQPHSTVMAFLSSSQDDVFFITFPHTFKSKLLKKDNQCFFAIDSRATFKFDQAIHWNYSIIQGEAYQVPKEHEAFHPIKELFIAKNPFEIGFFTNPEVEMYHVKPLKVVCPASARRF